MTSPARLPTKRRKWAGSHSRREESVHVVPPPDRTTVLVFVFASLTTVATPVSPWAALVMAAELILGPSTLPPRGAAFADVAAPAPSPVLGYRRTAPV